MRIGFGFQRTAHAVLTAALLCGAGTRVCAAEDATDPRPAVDTTSAPVLTLTAQTRDLDQVAAEGEWHLGRERFSVFVGIGYMPRDGEDERLGGIALFTGGGRVHVSWFRRRGYVELCWGPLARALRVRPDERPEQFMVYGPSLLLGYQQIARSGLTFLAAAGYGYTFSSELDRAIHNPEFRLGLGYTWRSRRDAARRAPVEARTGFSQNWNDSRSR